MTRGTLLVWWPFSRKAAKPLADESPPAVLPDNDPLTEREQANPLYRWLMHLGVPMSVSLAVHLLIISALALKTWEVLGSREIDIGEYSASIADSLAEEMKGAFQWSQEELVASPTELTEPSETLPDLRNIGRFDLRQIELGEISSLTGGRSGGGESFGGGEGALSILGTGAGAGPAGSGGLGDGFGGGGDRSGNAGAWGKFVRANKLVYVVDFSGSILVAVDDLKSELKRSIAGLKETQAFNIVIFYSVGDSYKTESFSSRLVSATPEAREQFFRWIERKAPTGSTEPLAAIKRALSMQPEAIFFFSDGYFDEKVVDAVTQANRGSAKICCFVFDELLLQQPGDLPPRATDGARRLQRISEQNGGWTLIVTGKELRGR